MITAHPTCSETRIALAIANNDHDLEYITVDTPGPFEVGDTLRGQAHSQNWLVHFHDRDTLLIAPLDRPHEWRQAHIYGRGGAEGH